MLVDFEGFFFLFVRRHLNCIVHVCFNIYFSMCHINQTIGHLCIIVFSLFYSNELTCIYLFLFTAVNNNFINFLYDFNF